MDHSLHLEILNPPHTNLDSNLYKLPLKNFRSYWESHGWGKGMGMVGGKDGGIMRGGEGGGDGGSGIE